MAKVDNSWDRKTFAVYKEYFLTEPEEDRKKLLAIYKRNNLVVLSLFLFGSLCYLGAVVGTLAYKAKQAGVSFSINNMGPLGYILGVISIVFVGFSLVRMITYLMKTSTEQGLVESFVEAKVKKLPPNKVFTMMGLAEDYEEKIISEEEYHEKLKELFKPVNIGNK